MKMRFIHKIKPIYIVAFILFPLAVFANEPQNLTFCKQAVTRYHDTGAYEHDINTVTNAAMDHVAYRVKNNNKAAHPKKLAAVFDVDETTLSNYPGMVAMSFGGDLKQIRQKEDQANDPAIAGTLKLYKLLKKDGVTIFIVTGRKPYQLNSTIKNLKDVGYSGWKQLILKSGKYDNLNTIEFKSKLRKKITGMGYDIILNIGDQWSDLKGGYADRTFKLPNPFYYLP